MYNLDWHIKKKYGIRITYTHIHIFNDCSYEEERKDGFHLILRGDPSPITLKLVTLEGSPMAIHLPALQALGCPPRSNSKFMVSKYQSSPSLDKCRVVSQVCLFLWFQKDDVVMNTFEWLCPHHSVNLPNSVPNLGLLWVYSV